VVSASLALYGICQQCQKATTHKPGF
jgi:hypothetical protein